MITYDVNIVQAGPVLLGSTINWQIFATVSGTANIGTNNGIASAVIDLQDSTGEMLNAGVVQTGNGQDFDNYLFPSGGSWNGTTLANIGAVQFDPDGDTRGEPGDLGPLLLATGSYQVTSLGLHTLSTVTSASDSNYFSTAGPNATVTPYTSVAFGSDSVNVVAAVPEPASLAMMALAACGAFGLRRRRQASRRANDSAVAC
ncbi:MAG: PEP-CTERM sorting domain-containing protein [Planctomycetaceae bacterium]